MPRERASSCRPSLRACKDPPGAGERYPQPVGPMRQLVFDFVEGFLQQKEIEQSIGVFHRLRPKPRLPECTAVGGEESSSRILPPTVESAREPTLLIGC